MDLFHPTNRLAAFAAIMLTLPLAAPALAGPIEIELLHSYIGSWHGEGMLTGGDEPEEFSCRLNIAEGNLSKINYAGRCGLVGLNLSVSGTIVYSDENRRYEAAMSSNSRFSGFAVGQRNGDRITFDLTETATDDGSNNLSIGSRILLENGIITVEFDVTFNESNQTLHASVPFAK